jgi:VCBS repeat protein
MQQSQLSSQGDRTLQIRVDCDPTGTITVKDIAVPFGYLGIGVDTTDGDIDVLDTIQYVESQLGSPEGADAVKYLILNDKNLAPNFVGIGYLHYDPVKSASNANRNFTTSALIARNPAHTVDGQDSWESSVVTHESLHVMNAAINYEMEPYGAVAAPYATTGFHCVDGIDILCYSDGGTANGYGTYGEQRCPASAGYGSADGVALDCEFDTYFDAKTEPGEWLSQWWNVGGSENPFLVEAPEAPSSGEDDVDGDGRSDLVTVDQDSTAHVFPGSDTGVKATGSIDSLSGQVDPALYDGGGHYLIDSADVTGEGRADLVTIKATGGVFVHRGLLNGTFAPAIEAIPGLKPMMNGAGDFEPAGVADVNGDGRGDLVGLKSSKLEAFLGQADGTFTAITNNNFTLDSALTDGAGHYLVDLADVTGEGRADLVTINSNGTAYVYNGLSDGKFGGMATAAAVNTILDDGSGEEPVGLGDVNLDGKADLLTLSGTTLKLYAGQSKATFTSPTNPYAGSINSSLLDGSGEELVGLFDYNRDNRPDLVSVDDQGDTRSYTAQSNATFAAPTTDAGSIVSSRLERGGQEMAAEKPFVRRTECSAGGCKWPPAPAVDDDVNGDGRADLVTVDQDGTANVFAGTATGVKATAPATSLSSQVDPALYDGGGHYLIDSADVTGEGRADLVTIKGTGGVFVHRGKGDRTFAAAIEAIPGLKPVMNGAGGFEPIAVADVNGDGYGDLIGVGSFNLSTYLGKADGTFNPSPLSGEGMNSALLDGSGYYPVDTGDVNGDGYADLVAMGSGPAGTVRTFKGQASGALSSAVSYPAAPINTILDNGTGEEPVGLGDVNLDGKADLLTLNGTTLKLYAGQSNATFANTATNPYAGSINSSLLDASGEELIGLFDYNRDNRPDLVSVDDQGDTRSYTAQSNATFAAPTTDAGSIVTSRFGSTGQEPASEKPLLRRTKCSVSGCKWPPGS